MRDQFYADRKDVLKWTLTLGLAGAEKLVLYVVMYRPNKGSHGSDFRAVKDADDRVVSFFERERKRFESGAPRRVANVARLLPGRIELIHEKYEHEERRKYFSAVQSRLTHRSKSEKYVILLDPDNGISGKCPKSEHICSEELSTTWSAMAPDDVMLVYQHQFRNKEWISKRRDVLASATLPSIICHHRKNVADVCFFELAGPRANTIDGEALARPH